LFGIQCGQNKFVQRKIFWLTFGGIGLVADLVLPFWWAVFATIPIGYACWWVAYRSDWF
jgi:hypothetical protein